MGARSLTDPKYLWYCVTPGAESPKSERAEMQKGGGRSGILPYPVHDPPFHLIIYSSKAVAGQLLSESPP